jgi:phosphatidylglycerophosphatase A
LAPGTFGSLEGVAIFAGLSAAVPHSGSEDVVVNATGYWFLLIGVNLLVFSVGVWASGRVARLLGIADPARVVIDEISGQLISITPLLFAPAWRTVVLGFILFRAFDILKPYPIGKLERLPGGWGIMADDVGAGILAAAILIIVRLARIV